ncbi:MAG: hypothetical protein ACTIDN_06295 [Acetobacter sp.]|uniref:hypothetical protein n=1 Tax=Acetobacter sp. TaxID=440 RepID=UPI003F91D060
MTDKTTGVFVPLDDGMLNESQIAKICNPKKSMTENLLAIGTPVTGGELESLGYARLIENNNIGWQFISPDQIGHYAEKGQRVAEATPIISARALLAARDAEIARLREAVTKTSAALERVTEERMTSYQVKNGRWVSIQGDDGERCDIIHSDVTTDCEAAIIVAHKAMEGGAA